MLLNTARKRIFLGADTGGAPTTGPIQRSETVVTNAMSPYTVAAADYLLLCDCSGGAITIDLPTTVGNTRELVVKKTEASINAVTLEPAGIETIEGAANNADLDVNGETFKLNSDNVSDWKITGGY